jgi:hypothetical protein
MQASFEHPAYDATSSYRVDWFRPADPGVIVHTESFLRGQFGPVSGTTPQRYLRSGFTKPSPLTGTYQIRVTAINAVGESPVAESAPFAVSAPGPVANIQVVDAHL